MAGSPYMMPLVGSPSIPSPSPYMAGLGGGGADVQCRSCGNIYASDSNFCRSCGHPRDYSTEEDMQDKKEFNFHAAMTVAWVGLTICLFWMRRGFDPVAWYEAVVMRVFDSLSIYPDFLFQWALACVVLSVGFMAIVGYGSDHFYWDPHTIAGKFDGRYCVISLLVTFCEEIVFRAALLPHNATGTEAVLAWIIYCIYHIDLIHLYLSNNRGFVVRDPAMLLLLDALGLGCVAIYLGTGGNLYASFLFHAAVHQAGLFLFNGIDYVSDVANVTCQACGNIYASDSLFCRKCGHSRDSVHMHMD